MLTSFVRPVWLPSASALSASNDNVPDPSNSLDANPGARVLDIEGLSNQPNTRTTSNGDSHTPSAPKPLRRSPSPASILASAPAIFPDDCRTMHGDPGAYVAYRCPSALNSARARPDKATANTEQQTGGLPELVQTLGEVTNGPATSEAYDQSCRGDDVVYPDELVLRLADPASETERRLFAHYVWNAALLLAELVGHGYWAAERRSTEETSPSNREDSQQKTTRQEQMLTKNLWHHEWSVDGQTVLELGAGAALPSLIATLNGARNVVVTDYPSQALQSIVQTNVSANLRSEQYSSISIQPHCWGDFQNTFSQSHAHHFSRIFAADTLWLEAQHEALLASVKYFLQKGGQAWFAAGFHTGRAKVAAFFELVDADQEVTVEHIWEVDINGTVRPWSPDRVEDIDERKRWCVVAVVRHRD